MAEEDNLDMDEMDALADAVTSDDDEGGEGDEELDPLAEEMLKMMEEEGDGGEESAQEDVDRMMEMEMLKAMEEEGGGGGLDMGGGGLAGGGGGGGQGGDGGIPTSIQRLMDVSLTVTIELGRTYKTLQEVMAMGEQSLVELDKQVGDPVNVLVNGELFARGEVVTVSENFGVRITELFGDINI